MLCHWRYDRPGGDAQCAHGGHLKRCLHEDPTAAVLVSLRSSISCPGSAVLANEARSASEQQGPVHWATARLKQPWLRTRVQASGCGCHDIEAARA